MVGWFVGRLLTFEEGDSGEVFGGCVLLSLLGESAGSGLGDVDRRWKGEGEDEQEAFALKVQVGRRESRRQWG